MTIQNYQNGYVEYIVRYEIKEIRIPRETSLLIDESYIRNEKLLNVSLSSYKSKYIAMIQSTL
jgi:hypothetical protein